MKSVLMCLCFFNLAASAWLGVMETILRHPGFDVRIVWAILLAATSLTTILYLMLPGYRPLRILLSLGAVLMLGPGISAIMTILGAAHFEGYILLVGGALILQGALTILTRAFVPDVPDFRPHL